MNNILHCKDNKQGVNKGRIKSGIFFTDEEALWQMGGYIGKNISFIEDSLLNAEQWELFAAQFREHADADGGWRGEFWGKMMRGACFVYSLTGSEKLYSLLEKTISDMLDLAGEKGLISSYPPEFELHEWDIWCRKYVLLGMQYFLEICKSEELSEKIIASMKAQADCIIEKTGRAEENKIPITSTSANWRGLNSSSILEPVVRLFEISGDRKYLDFASYIIREGGTSIENIFELAEKNIAAPYQYPVPKAYELISCFDGLLEYYYATGEEKYKTAVLNFAHRLVQSDFTVTGSAGCSHEMLDHSASRQSDSAFNGLMGETCVTVTLMKFFSRLLLLSAKPLWADLFEISLYNAYLGAVNTQGRVNRKLLPWLDGEKVRPLPFDSYSPLQRGLRGRGIGGLMRLSGGHYYGCCAAIGAAGIGLISKTALLRHENGFAVNLYIPGTIVTFSESGNRISLKTESAYPKDGEIEITLETQRTEEFEIWLRIPAWSEKSRLSLNKKEQEVKKGYTVLKRGWKTGDKIHLSLDMRIRIEKPLLTGDEIIITKCLYSADYTVPTAIRESADKKYYIALRTGPLALARDKRLGQDIGEAADIMRDENGFAVTRQSDSSGFDAIAELELVKKDGSAFKMIDYACAGKTWDETSEFACWLKSTEAEN